MYIPDAPCMEYLPIYIYPKNHPNADLAKLVNISLVGGIPTLVKNMKDNGKDYPVYEMGNKIHV